MAEDPQRKIFQIPSKPGIQRDGTTLDSPFYVDGQWVRFYRQRPKKMGGYKSVVEDITFQPRGVHVWSRNNTNLIYLFSSNRINAVQADNEATGSLSYDLTPTSFTPNSLYQWQIDRIYDATGGGENTIVAHPAANLDDIANADNTPVYGGEAGDLANPFVALDDGVGGTIDVSGGVVVLQPYVFAYGNDGFIKNSNANKPNDWQITVGGDANEVNVAGSKIVKGLPLRGGGQSPAGLFWSLDSVVKVSYVGRPDIFRYDTVSANSTVLSSSGIVEYDGIYFWAGVDRFYAYDGRVQELPNQMNVNWFFDNLNFANRQRVWATVVPRWGEIWWHFPYGETQEECNRAVIFNVREKTWYDCIIERSCGYPAKLLRYPIWCGAENLEGREEVGCTLTRAGTTATATTASAHGWSTGDPVLIQGADDDLFNGYYTITVTGNSTFTYTMLGTPAVSPDPGTTYAILDVKGYVVYAHEAGYNKVQSNTEVAIQSYIETSDFGFPTGGPGGEQPAGNDYWTRLSRVEPDVVQSGDMTLTVKGTEFANDATVKESSYTFSPTTTKIDMREQRRMIRLRFESNEVGGDYEMGRVILHAEPGDIRS